jgi:hypothetical protein
MKHHAFKTYGGWSGNATVTIYTQYLGIICIRLVSLMLRSFYHLYALDRRLSGYQSRSGRGDKEKKIASLHGNRTSVVHFVSSHCITEISRQIEPPPPHTHTPNFFYETVASYVKEALALASGDG